MCAGLLPQTTLEAVSYLKLAAENGHPQGQIDYTNAVFASATEENVEDKINEGLPFLDKAKSQGNAGAYYWSGFYGIFASEDFRRKLGSNKESSISDLIVAQSMYSQQEIKELNLVVIIDRELDLLFPESRESVI